MVSRVQFFFIKMLRTRLIMLRIFTWFHLFGVPTLIMGTTATTDISLLQKPTGRVSLFSFERGHLRTITESVDSEVVLTAAPRYFEAYLFECNATFPVQWAYIGEAAPVVTADVGRFFKDFYDVNTYTYQTILLMYSLQEMQSGRYICRGASKEHDKLAIHYDVFVPGNSTQILLSTSEKKLFIPESKEHAYIPCGVSDSTAAVNLYRGNQWGTFYPVPVNGSITFNPRKGFKIRFKDFLDPWGTYLCVSESNKKRRKVHLIPESLKAKYDSINHVSGKIPVYFSYEYEYNRVLCCTGTNFIPKLQWAGCGSILDCQVKSACFEEDRCEQRLGNSGYNPTKWIDPGPLPPGCSGYRLRDDPNGDFGLFKCSTPGIAQYQPYLLNRGNIFLDFEKTPPSEMILTLQRISPEGPSFVGDDLEFHCNSTRFYFAYGIRWGWEKVSGEIEFIDDATVVRDKYSIRGHRRRSTLKITYPDIKSVICFVPVVNSATEWRTVSLPVVMASNDINFIQHQNPTPNNVIDLNSLTYHTDYDTGTNNAAPIAPPEHSVEIQTLPQNPPQQNAQIYNSAKTPYQEIQGVVPQSPVVEQHNQNYYGYSHESSLETPHQPSQQSIPDAHHFQQNTNDIQSHQSRIRPIAQPHTVDSYSQAQASTPSPNIISISRSKKNRIRSGNTITRTIPSNVRSSGRTVPNLKQDTHYDTFDKDESYDTFEPRPSSSSDSNTRSRQRMQTSPSKIPHHQQQPSLSTHHENKRLTSSQSHRHNDHRNDILYSTSKKSYRDYNRYNRKHDNGDEIRLSLPFEPVILPSRSRYAHSSNYTTMPTSVRDTPSRGSSSSTSSRSRDSSRSGSRRPAPSQSSHSSSSRPSTRHEHDRHSSHDQKEKEYIVDNSYSQHIRLSLPSKNIGTHIPKLQKLMRNRGRTHQSSHSHSGHGRSRSHSSFATDAADDSIIRPSTDYYETDESPVEIKVPRTKNHDPYVSSHNGRTRHRSQHDTDSHHHATHSTSQPYRHSSPNSIRPDIHHSPSPTTYSRKRPNYSVLDTPSQPSTPQPLIHSRQDHPTHSHHHGSSNPATDSVITTTHNRHSYPSQISHPEYQQTHKSYHEGNSGHKDIYRSATGHRRSHSRGMKFDDNAAEGGAVIVDSYEITSPTARPAYFLSTPIIHQNSNEFVEAADMELQRVQPHTRTRTTTPRPSTNKGKGNSSADILHSVSISISSRVSLDSNGKSKDDHDDGNNYHTSSSHNPDSQHTLVDNHHNELPETEDYDIYSPQYSNYKVTTLPPPPTSRPVVPIQFFHVKPTDVSSFQPAKTIIDEEDEYDIG